jgi:hypothetical protein
VLWLAAPDAVKRANIAAMQSDRFNGPLGALRRKLRALAAVAGDAGATAPERENAEALKKRLEDRLRAAGIRTPAGDWTDHAFRLGQWAKGVRQSASPAARKEDWTDTAHQLGKAVGRGYKKWFAD